MISKIIGAVLLIAGITIGAGMLVLPISTGIYGFWSACIVFCVCWAVMTFSAFLILEACLWMPAGSNFPSVMKHTLYKPLRVVSLIAYLLLLYALMTVYLDGMSELLLIFVLNVFHVHVPHWLLVVMLAGVWAMFVHIGSKAVDPVNRLLIIAMLIIFGILVFNLMPHVDAGHLMHGYSHKAWFMLPIIVAAFGYQIIIPTLRNYLHGDVKALRLSIFIGTLIPLVVYLIWQAIIVGILPVEGMYGLKSLYIHRANADLLSQVLTVISQNRGVGFAFDFFAFFAIATSSICVGLALVDFLVDLLVLHKGGPKHRFFATAIAFIPPFFLATEFPNKLAMIFEYAGILTALLFILLPVIMVWRGRYSQYTPAEYRVIGGKIALFFPVLLALGVIIMQVFFSY